VAAGLAGTLSYAGIRVLLPAVVGTLGCGVWLVLENAAWDFGQLWVLLALGLFAVAFLIGAVDLSRIGTRLQRLAVSDGPTAANDGSTLLDRWRVGYGMVLVVLLIAVWDMVFKPGL
jgi:uncharacterized membrane protein